MKEHSDFKNKYSEGDIIKVLEFLVDNIFVVFAGKNLPADSWHSIGYELCPSSRRHLSVFFRSGIHSLCSQRKINSFLKKHLGSISLTGTSMMCCRLTTQNLKIIGARCILLNLRHNRVHHFRFLPRFTIVNWERWSTSHFHLRQTRWFQFPHHKRSVPE